MSLALASRRAAISPAWVKNPLWRTARAVPSLDQPFADTKSLVDAVTGRSLVTFTRASSGTSVGSDGLIKTAAVNEPRFDHNPTTGESLGLLVEEQRTNLLLNSATLSTQSVTVTAAAHTLSFTGTGTITLSGASTAGPLVGTGTGEGNRVSLAFTPTAGTLTLTVSGTVSNAQLEVGSFRTSYIPTTTAAATRSADVASITGTAFSSWYRQDEGTMFCDGTVSQGLAGFPWFYNITDGTVNNSIGVYQFTNGIYGSVVTSGVAAIPDPSVLFSPVSGSTAKHAFAVKTSDTRAAYNGSLSSAQTSTVMPTVNTLSIGTRVTANRMTGTIRRLTYWPARLSNSTLQSITQ